MKPQNSTTKPVFVRSRLLGSVPLGKLPGELEVFRCPVSGPAFDEILELRSKVYGLDPECCRDAADAYSEQYLVLDGEMPVYALRITRAAQGAIECEEKYPVGLVARFRAKLCSSGRFVRNPRARGSSRTGFAFLARVWDDQIGMGTRVDITNATDRLLAYYHILGYVRVEGESFVHPVWGTASHVLVRSVDPRVGGRLEPVFRRAGEVLPLDALGVAWQPCRPARVLARGA